MLTQDTKRELLELIAHYNWSLDTGDVDAVAAAFTEDGVFDSSAGRFEGRAAIREGFAKSTAALKGSMHFNANHQFEEDGEVIKHRCYLLFQLPTEKGYVGHPAIYTDEIVKVDGVWKFRLRYVRPGKEVLVG